MAVSDPACAGNGAARSRLADRWERSDGATVTIPLPDALANIDARPQTYTITLSTVQDDFNDGPYAVAGQVYTITVYPTPTTGIITSDGALTRR